MISIETRKFILKLILVFLYAGHDAYGMNNMVFVFLIYELCFLQTKHSLIIFLLRNIINITFFDGIVLFVLRALPIYIQQTNITYVYSCTNVYSCTF